MILENVFIHCKSMLYKKYSLIVLKNTFINCNKLQFFFIMLIVTIL